MDEEELKEKIREFMNWEQMSRDTIVVKGAYIDIAGDMVAGILLSQIIYWYLPTKENKLKLRVKDKNDELCLAKNREDWQKECRITPRQYDRAIKILKNRKLVSVKNSMFNGKKTPLIKLNIPILIEKISEIKCGF